MNTAKIIAVTQETELLRKLADMMDHAMDNSPEQTHDNDLLWSVWRELHHWKINNKTEE